MFALKRPPPLPETPFVAPLVLKTASRLLKELDKVAPLLSLPHPVTSTILRRLPDVDPRLQPTSYTLKGRPPVLRLFPILATQA